VSCRQGWNAVANGSNGVNGVNGTTGTNFRNNQAVDYKGNAAAESGHDNSTWTVDKLAKRSRS
jgi:hypothetical protein